MGVDDPFGAFEVSVATVDPCTSRHRVEQGASTYNKISCYSGKVSTTTAPATTETRALARFFRVLGDATRLRIVELLAAEARTVAELVAELDCPRSRVSNHLACLRHCQFVVAEPQGRSVRYRLIDDDLDTLLNQARQVAASRVEHLASCERIGPEWL